MAYYVDKYPQEENDFHDCEPHFPRFKTKKEAREFAARHGDEDLGPLPVLDKNGDTVPPRKTRKALKQEATEWRERYQGAQNINAATIKQLKAEAENRDRAMLAAGYVPLRKLRNMTSARVTGQSTDQGSLYTITVTTPAGDVLAGDIMTAIITGETP